MLILLRMLSMGMVGPNISEAPVSKMAWQLFSQATTLPSMEMLPFRWLISPVLKGADQSLLFQGSVPQIRSGLSPAPEEMGRSFLVSRVHPGRTLFAPMLSLMGVSPPFRVSKPCPLPLQRWCPVHSVLLTVFTEGMTGHLKE